MDVLSRFPLAVAVGTQLSVAAITMMSSQKTVTVIYYFTFMLHSLFRLTAIYLIKLKKEVCLIRPIHRLMWKTELSVNRTRPALMMFFDFLNSLSYLGPEKDASKIEKQEKGDRRQLILPPGYLFPAFHRFEKFLKRSVPD